MVIQIILSRESCSPGSCRLHSAGLNVVEVRTWHEILCSISSESAGDSGNGRDWHQQIPAVPVQDTMTDDIFCEIWVPLRAANDLGYLPACGLYKLQENKLV